MNAAPEMQSCQKDVERARKSYHAMQGRLRPKELGGGYSLKECKAVDGTDFVRLDRNSILNNEVVSEVGSPPLMSTDP